MTKYLLFLLTILFSCESTDLSLEQAYNHATTKLDPELNDVLLKHDELLASQGNGHAISLVARSRSAKAI